MFRLLAGQRSPSRSDGVLSEQRPSVRLVMTQQNLFQGCFLCFLDMQGSGGYSGSVSGFNRTFGSRSEGSDSVEVSMTVQITAST